MSLVIWTGFQSAFHPLYLATTLVFLAALAPVAMRARTPGAAAERGAMLGFFFGVAVWGSLAFYFDLSASQKLFHAGGIIVDGLWLGTLGQVVFRRLGLGLEA